MSATSTSRASQIASSSLIVRGLSDLFMVTDRRLLLMPVMSCSWRSELLRRLLISFSSSWTS